MPTATKQTGKKAPEHKIGPYRAGIGAAVWLNTIETANGPKKVRSVTISPRRYYDERDSTWKDSQSYRPQDLATLRIVIDEAERYLATTKLPGDEKGHDDDLENAEPPAY